MARYLTDLDDVLRAAGLTVIEVDGWKTRARSSGGYSTGRPTHVMIHHTASPPHTDGQRDVDYIVSGSPVRPVSNIYTDRKGVVWVCAAGATNTNGKGADTWGGGVPVDSMNTYAIGNEIANTGTGEPYPIAQQASVLRSTAALCSAYGIGTHHVRGHFEWAPTRKIDPSGPSQWATSGKWNMDAFRHDVGLLLAPPPTRPPTPIQGVPDVFYPINPHRNSDTRAFGGPGVAPNVDHVFGLDTAKFPADTVAVALNVVAVGAAAPGFVTVWPDGQPRPNASIINFRGDGGAYNGAIVVGVTAGKFRIETSATCHLIVDVTGYWTA